MSELLYVDLDTQYKDIIRWWREGHATILNHFSLALKCTETLDNQNLARCLSEYVTSARRTNIRYTSDICANIFISDYFVNDCEALWLSIWRGIQNTLYLHRQMIHVWFMEIDYYSIECSISTRNSHTLVSSNHICMAWTCYWISK